MASEGRVLKRNPVAESSSGKTPRRIRYLGKNPRRFDQKYKEHQPQRYASDTEKIVAGGRTLAGSHRPIMVLEILAILSPLPGQIAVDCTLGFGGHASHLLQAIQPGGKLIAIDADPVELPKTEARLRGMDYPAESLIAVHSNFMGLAHALAKHAPQGTDMLLADLGLSSMQIDDPARGFSYKHDGPLDMRMNPRKGLAAHDWLGKISTADLTRHFSENSDEPQAELLAEAILRAHLKSPLTTTQSLVAVVRQVVSSRSEAVAKATIQRVFQAIRIAINDEFSTLEGLLRQLPGCMKPGGRVAILSFHSGEDRRVKKAFRLGLGNGTYSSVAADVIRTSQQEQNANPRSTSAKLRWAIRS
jgi:16S rRNA (cytosine1402-N4)-methyltransferase